MIEFSGKHIVVTGAASGMGRLFTHVFLGLGARVAAWDIDSHGLNQLFAAASGNQSTLPERLNTYTCDLSSASDIRDAAARTLSELGHVDILVNNAGVVSGRLFTELTDEQMERTFAVNALAPMRVTLALLPAMKKRGLGHIVTIASAGGLIGTPRLADYCASKAAVFSFDESLRLELKSQGSAIKTTIVCPYYINTGMFSGVKTRFSWLLPILSPETVVKKTMRAIHKGQSRLILPWFVYLVFPLRVLPVSWFDGLASFLGITKSMEEFSGRTESGLLAGSKLEHVEAVDEPVHVHTQD